MPQRFTTPLASRRSFLLNGTLTIAAGSWIAQNAAAADPAPTLRIGLVTDLHHADKAPNGTRHYRETVKKFTEASQRFAQEKISCLVELGDLIDAAETVDTELSYLRTINAHLAQLCDDRHYVLGNHCVDTLHKEEFLGEVKQAKSYYSFDRGHVHFVILDACFISNGQPYGRKNSHWTDTNIPPQELEWLASDLKQTTKPTVVFVHQRLDVNDQHGVKNSTDVRKVLETAPHGILAVFQGHTHKNDLKEIAGIPYCTLVAMVEGSGEENNGYSLLDIASDFTLRLHGFRKQSNRQWAK